MRDGAAVLTIITASLLLAWGSLRQKSSTTDEPVHVYAGLAMWRDGNFTYDLMQPPVAKLLMALPLCFANVAYHPAPDGKVFDGFRSSQDFLFRDNDPERVLPMARLPILAVFAGLVVLCYLWARTLYGRAAGVTAALLCAFAPNMLAHARLATVDVACAAFSFAAAFALWRYKQRPGAARLVIAGVAVGLALGSKYSALMVVPAGTIGLYILAAQNERGPRPALAKRLAKPLIPLVPVLMVAGLALFVVHGCQLRPLGASEDFVRRHGLGPRLRWLNERVRLPLGCYVRGLHLATRKPQSAGSFLAGQSKPVDGWWWYYYPVVFAIKTPLAMLALLGLALWHWLGRGRRGGRHEAYLLAFAAVFFLAACARAPNRGIRYLLPMYPFLFVLVSGAAVQMARQRAFLRAGAALLLMGYVAASVRAYPHYIPFFNHLIGGPSQGWRYLCDSNIDWGQDLIGLRRYVQAHPDRRVKLCYWGLALPESYGVTGYEPVAVDDLESRPQGLVAISVNHIASLRRRPTADPWWRGNKPAATIGHSIHVYDLPAQASAPEAAVD